MRDGWQRTQLGDVTAQVTEAVLVEPDQSYTNLGLRMYSGGVFAREAKRGRDIKASRLFKVSSGQFIYNRLFAGGGAFGVVRPEHATGVVSNEFPVFEVDPSRMLTEFLYLHFQQPSVWDAVAEQCIGTTQTRLRWKEDRFRAYAIALPPLDEQRRIVDLVGSLDDTIAAAERAAAHAQRLYDQQVSVLQSTDGEPRTLGSFLSVAKSGGTPSRKRLDYYGGSIPWVKSGEVAGAVIHSTEETITESAIQGSSAWVVPAGAVLVAMYGATAAQVGRLGVDAATNQAVLALLPDPNEASAEYVYHLLRADSARLKSLATGAAQPNLSKGVILRQEYRLPNLREQEARTEQAQAILDAQDGSAKVVSQLRTLRSNLLTALLSGEHEIPESYDELLEVAS